MTKEQLRIRVSGTNRKYYLQAPAPERGQPDYFVRFSVPRALRLKYPNLPRTITRSTGFSTLSEAREKGREIIESILAGRFAEAEQTKRALACATWGEVIERYKPDARQVKPGIARRNGKALELVLRESLGRPSVLSDRMDAQPPDQVIKRWIRLRLDRVRHLDLVLQERAAVTINSTLTQARSVLSPKVMELYTDLKLPDLADFRAVRKLRVDQDLGYKPIPPATLAAVEADAQLLKHGESPFATAAGLRPDEQKQVYLVYLLMMRLGLRNNEACAARWGWIERWIERDEDKAQLVMKRRPDFVSKNKRYGNLQIDPELLAELDQYRGLPDAWIINEAFYTPRYNLCNRAINKWARCFLPADREKGAYEFRKHAGSIIASRPESEGGGIMAAAAFLRDSIATTEKHYVKFLRTVRGIRREEISSTAAA